MFSSRGISNEDYLFSCDLNWEVIWDSVYDTVDEARESAKVNHNIRNEDFLTK